VDSPFSAERVSGWSAGMVKLIEPMEGGKNRVPEKDRALFIRSRVPPRSPIEKISPGSIKRASEPWASVAVFFPQERISPEISDRSGISRFPNPDPKNKLPEKVFKRTIFANCFLVSILTASAFRFTPKPNSPSMIVTERAPAAPTRSISPAIPSAPR